MSEIDRQLSAEQAAVAQAPMGVSDQAMTGAWRVIIGRVPDRYVAYYYHNNDDARLRVALKLRAERWVARALAVAKPAPAFQDISHISEYGLTQKLSSAIRCF